MAGMTLAQLYAREKDPVAKWMEYKLLRSCKLLDLVPFEKTSSLKVRAKFWQKLPTGGTWRQINGGYTSAEDGQIAETEENLYAFGGDITFDNVMTLVTDTIKDPVQMEIDGKLLTMGLQWNTKFINGDVAVEPNAFDGIKKRVAGMPARQSVCWTSTTSSAPLDPTASAANARRFINTLRKAIKYCNDGQVSALMCNEDFILGISAALIYLQSAGNYLAVTKDQFDRDITTFKGIPLVDVGYQDDLSSEVISNAETAGDGGADSHSQYLASFDMESGIYGAQLNEFKVYDPLNGGEMETKPSKLRRVDWFNGLVNFGTRGIVRLYNLARLADWTEA
jgi:hypothetical protein